MSQKETGVRPWKALHAVVRTVCVYVCFSSQWDKEQLEGVEQRGNKL